MFSHADRPLTPLHAIVARTNIYPLPSIDKTLLAQSTAGERRIETETSNGNFPS